MERSENLMIIDIFKILFKNIKIIILSTSILSVGVVIFSLSMVDIYHSEALVKSSESNQNSSALSSQYSGLASLAGISMQSGSTDNLKYASKLLKSRKFFQYVIEAEQDNVIVPLIAGIGFNKSNEKIILDSNIYNEDKESFTENIEPGTLSYLNLHRAFLKNLYIENDLKNGFMIIQYRHYSPIYAEYIVNLLIDSANSYAREKSKIDAKNAMNYLQAEYENTSKANIKELINSLIENNMKSYVYSETKPDFLMEVIDPGYQPDKKYSPNRTLICILGAFVSLILSSLIVFLLAYIKTSKE